MSAGALTRDDRDRLLIAGGLAWIWATTPFALDVFGMARAAPGVSAVVYLPALAVLVLLAALAMWRHQAWARAPIVAVALALPVLAALTYDNVPATLAAGAGALAVAFGAARMRIPPERIPPPAARAGGGRESVFRTADPAADHELRTFLETASHLDRERTRVLAAAWRSADPGARQAAWREVRREADLAGRTDALEALRREIELWGRAAGGSPWTWEWATMTDIDRSDVRRGAMPALLDAAAAILLRDRLSTASVDVLLGPWEATMAEPAAHDPPDQP